MNTWGISWVHQGCSVHWGEVYIMSTLGDVQYIVGFMMHVEDIISTSVGVQYTGGILWVHWEISWVHRGFQYKLKGFITLLPHMHHNIPSIYWTSPDVIMVSPDVIMVSPNVLNAHYTIFLLTGLRIYTSEYKAQGPTLCPTEGRALRGQRLCIRLYRYASQLGSYHFLAHGGGLVETGGGGIE